MSEEPKKKPVKIRYEAIEPKDIIDVWRLYERSLREAPPEYPSMNEETPEAVRAHLFQMIASPNFLGVIAKHGKKPVAQVTGMVAQRPFGSPRVYVQMGIFWVEPEYRKQKIGEQILKEIFTKAKTQGVHHFESLTEPKLVETFLAVLKGKGKVVSHRIGGKIVLE